MAANRDADGLTVQQALFVHEYLLSGNATDAYRKAKYKAKDAPAGAHEILTNPKVSAVIEKRRAAASKDAGVDEAMIYRGLRAEAEHRGDGSSHSARVSAWMGLAKLKGLLKDSVEVTGEDKRPVVLRIVHASDQSAGQTEGRAPVLEEGRPARRRLGVAGAPAPGPVGGAQE